MTATRLPALAGSAELRFDPPAVQKQRLNAGFDVWLVERPDLSLVWLRLVLKSGADADPVGKCGTASLTADVLDAGTPAMNALQISSRLQHLGSSLRAGAGHDGSSVTMTSLERSFDETVRLFGSVLTEAIFPEAELDRLKRQRITSIVQQKNDPGSVASAAFHRIVYGDRHVYGTDAGGTESSVKGISRGNLLEFYRTWYKPNAGTIIAIGNLSMSRLGNVMEPSFSRWARAAMPTPRRSSTRSGGRIAAILDRPGAPQSEIRLGMPGPPRGTPDFFPLVIMNRILGGQFSSRLNANLRERRGFTYGARSAFGFGKYGGPFVASAAVNTNDTGEALREFVLEIERMRDVGITEEELKSAREGMIGGFALAFESPSQIGALLQNIVLYGLPEDYLAAYVRSVQRVTREEVHRIARTYLDLPSMAVVVVGDLKALRPQMEGAGLGEVREVTAEELGI